MVAEEMENLSRYYLRNLYLCKIHKLGYIFLHRNFQENILEQAQLGVPHSRIQVELGFILQAGTCQIINFAQNPRQSQSVQDTAHNAAYKAVLMTPSSKSLCLLCSGRVKLQIFRKDLTNHIL